MLQVGVDCEQISRFRRLPYSGNKRFYQKIFTQPEIKYCISYRDPYPRFAVRFAAKEASIKALNSIVKPNYHDIEVRKDGRRQPSIYISRKMFGKMGRFRISLSLAHSKSLAVAFVVVADSKFKAGETRQVLRKSTSYLKKRIGR